MNQPRITVVTPSYNQAGYLEQTLRSVIGQNYRNVEYIVIDGGSSDGSAELIERYNRYLAYWCSEKDAGQSDAIAKGFDRATGDILCWLNSDDILLPGALERVAEWFSYHAGSDVVNGGAYVIDATGKPSPSTYGSYTLGVNATFDRFRFFGQEGVFQQATFWRRSAYQRVGGLDRDLTFIMDLDLFTRLARRRPFDRIPHMLACFRLHEECKSARIQHIRAQEWERYAGRYLGTDRDSPKAKWMYNYYRNQNRARKLYLAGLRKIGFVRLAARPAANTRAAELLGASV